MSTMAFVNCRVIGTEINSMQPGVRGGLASGKTWFKETAAQTYKAGDLVYLDASLKTVSICTVDGTPLLDSLIAGIALKAATGVTGAQAHIHPLMPWDRVLMNVYHGTPGSAITAQTTLGTVYGITRASGSSNRHCVDLEHTTLEDATNALARVRVVDFPTTAQIDSSGNQVAPAIGDTYGLVIVHFLPFSIASDGTPFARSLQLY